MQVSTAASRRALQMLVRVGLAVALAADLKDRGLEAFRRFWRFVSCGEHVDDVAWLADLRLRDDLLHLLLREDHVRTMLFVERA